MTGTPLFRPVRGVGCWGTLGRGSSPHTAGGDNPDRTGQDLVLVSFSTRAERLKCPGLFTEKEMEKKKKLFEDNHI